MPFFYIILMSHINNSVAPGSSSEGVVGSNTRSFITIPQESAESQHEPQKDLQSTIEQMTQSERLVPAGLKALCETCCRLYPDQPNPLQVTTRLKYWLGGHDPLDYISMYWNPGRPEENIPPHWHYVSFGLSDLHGDGRVHPPAERVLLATAAPPPPPPPSGYGLELTFRLSAQPGAAPPLWPAALLQALARYVFATGNKFCAGDHISWHAPLDADVGGKSRLRHLLVADDPQLPTVNTPHGTVSFLQMVGCTGRELRAAQRGSGLDVLKLISEDHDCGGKGFVTVLSRSSSRKVRVSNESAAGHLAGVSARVRWHRWNHLSSEESVTPLSGSVEQQIKETLQRGLTSMSTDRSRGRLGGNMSTDSFEMSSIERALADIGEPMQGSWRSEDAVEYLEGVHIVLNAEGASLLSLAVDGRVLHGRHFTWRECGRAVTVLAASVAGAFATVAQPYAVKGNWLQVLIPKELAQDMSQKVANLTTLAETDSESDGECERDGEPPALPLTLAWPKYKLKISVVHDRDIL